MDPIATMILTQLAKPWLDKATDPETVAKGINWVLSAANHFLKIRQGETDPGAPAPPPPEAQTTDVESQDISAPSVKPDLDTFKLEILATRVESSMKNIQTYARNLQDLLERAGLEGGEEYLDTGLRNRLRKQRAHLGECLNELAGLMEQVYGVKVQGFDELTQAIGAD